MSDKPAYTPSCVMITGATGDFGQAFAARFAALGCRLVLHGRDAQKLDAMAGAFSVPVYKLLFDITDRDAARDALHGIPDTFFPDVLINNAGAAFGLDKAQDANLDDWEAMIALNDTALVRVTHAILPGMVKRQRGHIINIGSTAGNYAYTGGNVYGASKAFVKQFSLCLRSDLAGTKVRVTNLEPGQVETQFSLARFKGDAARAKAVYANTVSLSADDVADAAFWVATLPAHVNINRVEMMPTMQHIAGLAVERSA